MEKLIVANCPATVRDSDPDRKSGYGWRDPAISEAIYDIVLFVSRKCGILANLTLPPCGSEICGRKW